MELRQKFSIVYNNVYQMEVSRLSHAKYSTDEIQSYRTASSENLLFKEFSKFMIVFTVAK